MITYTKNESGKEILEVTGKVFIIPNNLHTVGDFKAYSYMRHALEKMLAANEHAGFKPLMDNDQVVQLWMHCDESDNICLHGIPVNTGSEEEYIAIHAFENLPCKFFKGKKEGDVVELFYAHKGGWRENDPEEDIEITFKLTLDQLNSTYARFGKFEEVLRKLGYYGGL